MTPNLNKPNTRMQLPYGWKKLNFFCLNIAASFLVMLLCLRVSWLGLEGIIIKAFGTEIYDLLCGWIAILFTFFAGLSGALGLVRAATAKKIISSITTSIDLSEEDSGSNTDPTK